jgi:formate C-acetyltransferase
MVLNVELLPSRIQNIRKNSTRKFTRSDGKLGITVVADIERGRYMTESFKQTDGEPYAIRRAKALANYLNKKTLFIEPDTLLAGHIGCTPNSIPFYMEYMPAENLREAIGSKMALTEDEWKELETDIIPYWKGKTVEEKVLEAWPEELRSKMYPPDSEKYWWVTQYRWPQVGIVSNLRMLFDIGMNGVKKKIQEKKAAINEAFNTGNYDFAQVRELMMKRDNYTAMEIMADAFINYIDRYSKLASDMAAKENDPTRKAELEQMSKNLNIREPIQSFWQAVQFAWIDDVVHYLECNTGGPFHRYDQIFWKYYKKDLETGAITKEKAKELIMDLWLKYERSMSKLEIAASRASSAQGSTSLLQSVTLGGVDALGRDCTNELTYMMLECSKELQSAQPNVVIRYHSGTPDELIAKAWETCKTGMGMPAWFHDKPIIEHLLKRGVTLEDARDNVIAGCVSYLLEGKNVISRVPSSGAMSAAKMMEYACFDGFNLMTRKQEGTHTGDPRTFKTFEEVVNAVKTQIKDFWTPGLYASQISKQVDIDLLPCAYSSMLSEMCLEGGWDARQKQDYELPFFGSVGGMVDVADSLAAIKYLVFDTKKLTMDEMLTAVKANWKGYEHIQKLCKEAPKFGDDNDYVDGICVEMIEWLSGLLQSWKEYTGKYYTMQFHSASTFMIMGNMTWALPNGRKAHEPTSDGGISPELGYGKDITKVMKSVAKVDASKHMRLLLNQRLNPNTTTQQFINLMRAWGDLEIGQIQFNVFKTETLREAQAKPENYPDLLVRIAGFSAVFVFLAKPTQEAIIARSENAMK